MARPRVKVSRNKIIQLYIVENKSGLATARALDIGHSTLMRYLDCYGLVRKTLSQSMRISSPKFTKTPCAKN